MMLSCIKRKPLILVAFLMLLAACEDFLSKPPTKDTKPIESVEQLEALLNDVSIVSIREANPTAVYSTDDTEIPLELYKAWPSKIQNAYLYFYTFMVDEVANEPADNFWASQYVNIYNANLIIENADRVSGSTQHKARVKAEAHFVRAYSYWTLASYYCLPYCPSHMDEQGLPKRLSTDMEENIGTMTLRQTYELIDSDVAEALKVDKADSENTWRADKATVNAFLSRYYLHKGEYGKAVEAASYALSHRGAAQLKDYNTLAAGVATYYTNPLDTIMYSETNSYTQAQAIKWEEFYYARYTYATSQWFMPSQSLVSLYDKENDMRYKWFFSASGNRRFGITAPKAYRYSIFSDGRYIFSGLSVQEVMLNKAEALLRMPNPNIQESLSLINELRKNRLKSLTPNLLVGASSKEEALLKVLEERRRELPFAYRWYDIRRFSVNETPIDDVELTRTFYAIAAGSANLSELTSYTLSKRRYAIPINKLEIQASKGAIKQNTY